MAHERTPLLLFAASQPQPQPQYNKPPYHSSYSNVPRANILTDLINSPFDFVTPAIALGVRVALASTLTALLIASGKQCDVIWVTQCVYLWLTLLWSYIHHHPLLRPPPSSSPALHLLARCGYTLATTLPVPGALRYLLVSRSSGDGAGWAVAAAGAATEVLVLADVGAVEGGWAHVVLCALVVVWLGVEWDGGWGAAVLGGVYFYGLGVFVQRCKGRVE